LLSAAANKVAIIVGGGSSVLSDVLATYELIKDTPRVHYVINDMIVDFAQVDIAVTLHPEKLENWLTARAKSGAEKPQRCYAHITRRSTAVTHATSDWLGSSGLFAVKIALENLHKAIILCGVPMDASHHYRRQKPWTDHRLFQRAWIKHHENLEATTRSWGGWTAARLGVPTAEWLAFQLR